MTPAQRRRCAYLGSQSRQRLPTWLRCGREFQPTASDDQPPAVGRARQSTPTGVKRLPAFFCQSRGQRVQPAIGFFLLEESGDLPDAVAEHVG